MRNKIFRPKFHALFGTAILAATSLVVISCGEGKGMPALDTSGLSNILKNSDKESTTSIFTLNSIGTLINSYSLKLLNERKEVQNKVLLEFLVLLSNDRRVADNHNFVFTSVKIVTPNGAFDEKTNKFTGDFVITYAALNATDNPKFPNDVYTGANDSEAIREKVRTFDSSLIRIANGGQDFKVDFTAIKNGFSLTLKNVQISYEENRIKEYKIGQKTIAEVLNLNIVDLGTFFTDNPIEIN